MKKLTNIQITNKLVYLQSLRESGTLSPDEDKDVCKQILRLEENARNRGYKQCATMQCPNFLSLKASRLPNKLKHLVNPFCPSCTKEHNWKTQQLIDDALIIYKLT